MLKSMLKDKLPREILLRKKAGFNPPLAKWMKTSLVQSSKLYLLSANSPLKNLQTNMIKKMFDTHIAGKANLGEPLWLLLVLAVWLDINNIEYKGEA